MIRITTSLLLRATALLLATNATAQDLSPGLSVEQIQRETLQDSLTIQTAESVAEQAHWRQREAFSSYLPSVTANATYYTQKKYMLLDVDLNNNPLTIPQIFPTTLYTLQAHWPLFDGWASRKNYSAGRSEFSAAQHELEWSKFTNSRQAVLQFYKSMASETLRTVAEQNLRTIRDHLKDVQALKRAGISTNYDVLRVEVQVSEAESELLNAQDNAELSKYKLGEVLGKEVETRAIVGQLPVLDPRLVEQLTVKNASGRGDIVALRERVTAAQFASQAAARHWVPRLALVGQYQYYNNINDRFDDQDAFRNAYQLGLSLTWNLFDGFKQMARSAQESQKTVQLEKRARQTQIKAEQDLEFWKRKYRYFCAIYSARRGDIDRSNEAVRLAQVGRRAGTRTSSELLDAETDLFRARAGLVNAQIGSVEALISLEIASGQKLYDFK